MFDQIRTALIRVYNELAGMITIVAAVAIAVCTIGMMACKNQRTVDEFKAWRTRIMITWVVFFMLGAIVNFGGELVKGMKLTSDQIVSQPA